MESFTLEQAVSDMLAISISLAELPYSKVAEAQRLWDTFEHELETLKKSSDPRWMSRLRNNVGPELDELIVYIKESVILTDEITRANKRKILDVWRNFI